jgi:hypothetical protein
MALLALGCEEIYAPQVTVDIDVARVAPAAAARARDARGRPCGGRPGIAACLAFYDPDDDPWLCVHGDTVYLQPCVPGSP